MLQNYMETPLEAGEDELLQEGERADYDLGPLHLELESAKRAEFRDNVLRNIDCSEVCNLRSETGENVTGGGLKSELESVEIPELCYLRRREVGVARKAEDSKRRREVADVNVLLWLLHSVEDIDGEVGQLLEGLKTDLSGRIIDRAGRSDLSLYFEVELLDLRSVLPKWRGDQVPEELLGGDFSEVDDDLLKL